MLVRDPIKKQRLGELYLPLWRDVTAAVASGATKMTSATGQAKSTKLGFSNPAKALIDGNHFAEHFGEHPLIIVVCVDISGTHPTDTELGRLSIVGGASVYPMAQNLCLALRSQGVATSLTTLLVASEPEVKEPLAIPPEYSTACHIAAGYRPTRSRPGCDERRSPRSRSSTVSATRCLAHERQRASKAARRTATATRSFSRSGRTRAQDLWVNGYGAVGIDALGRATVTERRAA